MEALTDHFINIGIWKPFVVHLEMSIINGIFIVISAFKNINLLNVELF
jgi:hypothetical protein